MLFPHSNIISLIIVVVYVYTLLSTVLVIIMQNRNPIRSIAWIVALIFLPFLGLFLYLIFGQNIRQRKKINKLSFRNVSDKKKDFHFNRNDFFTQNSSTTNGLIKLLYNNNDALPYNDSKIDIFTSGKETFEAIFKDVEAAKNHVHVEFYIIENDEVGNRLRDILIKKAQQGVEVRVIYDYWGSFRLTKRFLHPMQQAGVKLYAFFPPKFPFFLSRINYRNHRKIIVVDGLVAYTGGLNVAHRYFKGDFLGQWRDTMLRLEGLAVNGLQEIFINDWFFVDRNMLNDEKYFPPHATYTKNSMQLVDAGPDTEWMSILQGIFYAITKADSYVYIQTPYFMPPEVLLTAIETAALRGLDVRLMLPKKSDASIARSSNSSYIQLLLNAGVKVYFYENGFLHSKVIVLDDEVSIVGTSNLDFRSFEQNFEVNAFVYSTDTAIALKEIFLKDMQYATQVIDEEWRKRSKIRKAFESFARLFSPMM